MPKSENPLDGRRSVEHASTDLEWNAAEREFLLGPATKSLSEERRKRVAVSIRRGRLVFVSVPNLATPAAKPAKPATLEKLDKLSRVEQV